MREGRSLEEDQLSGASVKLFTVDSFANGISFGSLGQDIAAPETIEACELKLNDDIEGVRLRSRFPLGTQNPVMKLERYLMRLSRLGVLRSSIVYFGTATDPFFPFEGKFDASIKFLDMFLRYTPGLLVVQTRSPLIVIAMPVLKKLGIHAAVTIGVETCLEESIGKYTPGLPRMAERLKTATALRRFGVEVTLQVNPVLPYGDWKADAPGFARTLADNADYIQVKGLSDGSDRRERAIRNTFLAKRLAEDRKFQWLRPDSHLPLLTELEKIAPEKLCTPKRKHLAEKQMRMFAA